MAESESNSPGADSNSAHNDNGGPPSDRNGSSSDRDLIAAARAQAEGAVSRRTWAVRAPAHIPGYEIVREIHRGGQGIVYQAIQHATKRKVAVKVMRDNPLIGSRGRARFEREVEILGQLQHPNIVSVIDSGEVEGSFYYVMDYISGRALDEYVTDANLSLRDMLDLFQRICKAISAAHLKGVIHRDLKPSNILVDPDGAPHIVDFGLAKIATGEVDDTSRMQLMTITGQFIGSLPWASPEQAIGAPDQIDIRTDVYSLGVLLYQMVTGGQFPYEVVGNMRDVLDNIVKREPARPSTIKRSVDDDVETIVLKCLSKERDRRYQSAGDLGRDIGRYLQGAPIEAKRDRGWYVLRKTLRRYKPHVAVAAVFLVTLIVFAGVMTGMWRSAESARREAVAARESETAALAAESTARARAERNFGAVRHLAHTFMFDFYDEVMPLRGTTRAQELIIAEAAAYLEQVKEEGSDDPEFLRELADAHERLGDLRGGVGMKAATTGSLQDAKREYEAAKQIRSRLLEKAPEEARAHAEMAESVYRDGWIAQQDRRYEEASGLYGRAVQMYEKAIELAGDEDTRRAYEEARHGKTRWVGEVELRRAQETSDEQAVSRHRRVAMQRFDETIGYWSKRSANDPADAYAEVKLARATDQKATAVVELGHELRREGEALVDEERGDRAVVRLRAAIDRYEAAFELSRQALSRLEAAAERAPGETEALRSLWLSRHNAGLALMWKAKTMALLETMSVDVDEPAEELHANALVWYQRALDVAQQLAWSDAANLQAQRDHVVCLNKVGNQQLALGELAQAMLTFAESLRVREDIYKIDPTQRHRSDLAVGQYKLGQAIERMADAAADATPAPAQRLEQYVQAGTLYTECEKNYRAIATEGGALNTGNLETVRRAIERVNARVVELVDRSGGE